MKALLKDRKTWVDIDTSCLFNNQYNTIDGKRIFDQDITAIRDDARAGMGKCRYCGAMVKRGEEEKHFSERENQGCAGCFWQRERATDSKTTTETTTTTNENGERVTIKTRTTVEKLEKVCSYAENDHGTKSSGCTLKECRRMGIEWFTPENTFFLKYPGGFDTIPEIDKLPARGFVLDEYRRDAHYCKKIGSYTLIALLSYDNQGKATGVKSYRVYNCRRDYNFRYENGELFTDKYSFGWYKVKTLDGIPADVMQAIKNICNH